MKKQKIALTGGGSGGHILPLLATYNYFKEKNKYDFLWIGEEYSLEEDIAEKNKIKFLGISAGKLRRYFDIRNFYEPLKNLTGIFQGIYYILKHKIDIVFSKGGYVSMPLCIAAFILRKKIYIHESDIKTGLANKLVEKIATKVFYTFSNEKTEKETKKKRHIATGQILNPELLDYVDEVYVKQNEKLNILVIAGSQGSKTIFLNLLKILPDLEDIKFHIILGEKNTSFKNNFKEFKNVTTYDFLTQRRLGNILKTTDIAITRGSATTLWELNVFGIHSIIIPITEAGDHQKANAIYFKEKFGSDILDEKDKLNLEMFRLIQKYKDLRKSGLNLGWFQKPLEIIEKELEKK